jgi:acetylornithine deacetylase/succinyl-diaminopimelate desuccinylase-like protein
MNDSRISDLFEFLRFPSVSTQSEHVLDMIACAEWLKHKFFTLGFEADVFQTGGHPAVIARTGNDPARPTILIYGHYDVQPPEPLEEWTSPPFEPSIRDGRVYARGSTDNKGQIMAHILGAAELLARGGVLPANLIFLVEGEEEIGSDNLGGFLEQHRAELDCDVIVISDTGMAAQGYPTLTFSLRGIAALQFNVHGPTHDLHSGVFGGAVANPAMVAARLIASLHDEQGRVAIDGFYNDVRPLLEWERAAAAALPITEADICALAGVTELAGEPGFTAIERVGARPTAEVNGMGGGYQGEGTKTVLPREAFAKLTFRLVPNQRPDEILRLAEAHLQARCPKGVRLEIFPGHCGEPYYVDPNSVYGKASRRALERVFGRKPALMREGGSIPIVTTFKKILGADSLLLALAAPDCRAHSPNENFPLENFFTGMRLNQAIIEEIGRLN